MNESMEALENSTRYFDFDLCYSGVALENSAHRKAEEMLRKTNRQMTMARINKTETKKKSAMAIERRNPLVYWTEGTVATNSGVGFERFERVDFARIESNHNSLDNCAT